MSTGELWCRRHNLGAYGCFRVSTHQVGVNGAFWHTSGCMTDSKSHRVDSDVGADDISWEPTSGFECAGVK